mmetsp:Transcript_32986/g.93424  ORF Transcript_32986/g.93424 Transcript_32986/m.93424 type:complete len:127 (-) Transcript_32986:185-565(-)|eukprot:CAMPEP_0117681404 /NCGR_PEP_ID=MMETSP0804-20121206/18962_1 /TAXON_ID=1074897 /ORGANISM="Tetraselmis astigmatica, Strain CCMP880" /LENGTH=126 /DNA_ID=CAMNT_0005491155 /DNA_START=45 /DNA_END=425 /DNA_ORIENTATION=-
MKYRGRVRNRGVAGRDRDDEDEVQDSTCCGLRWKPLMFLLLFVGPAIMTALVTGGGALMHMTGLELPSWLRAEPPSADTEYRTRLLAFYKRYNPKKMGEVDDLLKKYKGKEQKLLLKLQKKYNAHI